MPRPFICCRRQKYGFGRVLPQADLFEFKPRTAQVYARNVPKVHRRPPCATLHGLAIIGSSSHRSTDGRCGVNSRSEWSDRQARYATPARFLERHTLLINSLRENPRESINWRRHRNGCPSYRVRWFTSGDPAEPMYQVYCLHNTPPTTFIEQEKCLNSRTECWRIAEARQRGEADIPLETIRRRTGGQRSEPCPAS